MTDVVEAVIQDITAKVRNTRVVRQKTVSVYGQEDLLNAKIKLSYPCAGVLYLGMQSNGSKSGAGVSVDITCEVYLIGGTICESQAEQQKSKVLSALAEIRSAILDQTAQVTGARRAWSFKKEVPVALKDAEGVELLAYVQRWSTVALLTS